LLIDLDPQANLSQSLLINQEKTIYGALKGEYKLQPVSVLKFGCNSVNIDLSGAEIELSSEPGREYFKRINRACRSSYDYIIIDSPPSLGLLTINSFTAADEIIIPLQAQFWRCKVWPNWLK
jgi:chromosome partitioning protein